MHSDNAYPFNMFKTFKPFILYGAATAGLFILYWVFTLIETIHGAWEAQLAVAFISAPTSAWIYKLVVPIAETVFGHSSGYTRAAEWGVILIAGIIQYFLIGFVLSLLLFGGSSKDKDID